VGWKFLFQTNKILFRSGDVDLVAGDDDDFLVGGTGSDTLNGLGGNDVLDGDGGVIGVYAQDTINAGDGNDYIIYDGLDQVDGGSGADTLILTGNSGIDFSTDRNIKNIEKIDLTYGPGSDGSTVYNGDHAITNLSISDVQAMTGSDHKLYIVGNSGDSVGLETGWSDQGPDGAYEHVYVDSLGSPTVYLYIDLVP